MKHSSRHPIEGHSESRALRRYLDQESRRLEQAIARQQELIKAPGSTRGELLEEAAETTEQAQSISVLELLCEQLAQVNAARQRLAEGKYGICQKCGQPIPSARLKALPYATLCVHCQDPSAS